MKRQLLLRHGLSLIGSAIVLISGALLLEPRLAQADELYVDKNCRINQSLPQYDRYTVFYTSKFVSRGQNYFFYAARYQDGAGILCTFSVEKERFQLIDLNQVKNQFIRSGVSKDSTRNAAFLVPVANGNGLRTSVTVYRLDLSNPEKPILTFLRKGRE